MSHKSKKVPYKELVKHCKNLNSASILFASLVLRRLKKKKKVAKSKGNAELLCCRTCLGTDQLEPIFADDADDNRSFELQLATGLEILKDDGLPQTICVLCTKLVKENQTFRDDCKSAERQLYDWGFNKASQENGLPAPAVKKERQDYVDSWEEVPEYADDAVQFDDANERYEAADYEHLVDNSHVDEKPIKTASKKKGGKKKKTNMPPFKCHICKKLLANASSLRTHVKWHTGQTAYICETCGKRCINRTAFLQHMKGKHGLQRTDKCTYCDYMALNKEQLKIHERRHTGERPYICDHCGSGFHRRANLVQHLPIHLSVKTIQCDLCPSTFKSSKFLATHKSRAHSNKQYSYVCHICNMVYKKSFNVRKHLLKVHGVPREQQGSIVRVRVRSFGDSMYTADV